MKRAFLMSLAGLTLLMACSDTLTRPTEMTDAPRGRFAPRWPSQDDIANNLDASVDADAEVMALNVGGGSKTTQLYLIPTNSDEKNGCNLTGSSTVSFSVASSDVGIATVSPASVTFSSCGDTKTLIVTPVAQGSVTISLTETGNTTVISKDDANPTTFVATTAAFTVSVAAAAPSNTAPTVVVTGVTGGANYPKGSVPAAGCQVTDAEDGAPSVQPVVSAITGAYAADGIGSQTVTCSYTDQGGILASSSKTYNVVDPSAPVIGYTLAPTSPDGLNDWYTSDVTLTWNLSELQSPNSLQKSGCVDQSIAADQVETTYSCSATSAGGSVGPVDVKIKRDGSAPTVAYTSADPAAANGTNGWYTSNVTATFTASDPTSGVNGSATAQVATSGEGAGVTASSPAFSDQAGNTTAAGAATSPAFKIDLTDPTDVAFVGGPTQGASYYFGSVPPAPTCTAMDAVSGLVGCVVSGYSSAVGNHTVTATATDNAGRAATLTRTYTVLAWTLNGFYQPVDMNNVVNSVKSGSTVPFKFEVFAGPAELTAVALVKSFLTTPVACTSLEATTDDIESTTTGGTSLRYDATSGQFVQNWQTIGKAGTCFKVTLTTQDESKLTAFFKLK
jgi:hypothetical protein